DDGAAERHPSGVVVGLVQGRGQARGRVLERGWHGQGSRAGVLGAALSGAKPNPLSDNVKKTLPGVPLPPKRARALPIPPRTASPEKAERRGWKAPWVGRKAFDTQPDIDLPGLLRRKGRPSGVAARTRPRREMG